MASASFSLAFSVSIEIVKRLLKTTKNKKKNHNKSVTLAKNKLTSIESKTFEELINNETSHENFMTIINEQKKASRTKRSIRMMNSHRRDAEKINLIKEGQK